MSGMSPRQWGGPLAMRRRPASVVLGMVIVGVIGMSLAATGAWSCRWICST